MCRDCWTDYGCPSDGTPAVLEAAEAIRRVYKGHPAGGTLHVVLDDWNLSDDAVAWRSPRRSDDGAESTARGMLSRLTVTERAAALARAHGLIPWE